MPVPDNLMLLLGSIVTPKKIIKGSVVVKGGKITAIRPGYNLLKKYPEARLYDYRQKGLYILPGAIEVHGHFREPGLEHKEDIPHATRAALAGGYTTVFDMPNTKPPTTTARLVKDKIALYKGRSGTDFAINMGAAVEDIDEIKEIEPGRITGVKIFTAGHATTPTTIVELKDIAKVFEILGKRKIMALLHAENQQLVDFFTNKYQNELGRKDPLVWSEARNTSVVLTAALEMIALAKQFNVKLYLLHLSTPEEFAAVEFGRQIGVDVYGEAVTYQLFFTTKDYQRYGNLINVAPALRSREAQKKIWHLLRLGKIDVVSSEHTPHTLKEKQTDVWQVASGIPNIQESLPALITGWVKNFGKENLEEGLIRLAQLTSGNIAHIFGFKQKGAIAVNKDADVTVVDTQKKWTIKKEDLFTKCGWSAYEGHSLIGRPVATFLRGNLVYEHGKIVGDPQGKLLTKS